MHIMGGGWAGAPESQAKPRSQAKGVFLPGGRIPVLAVYSSNGASIWLPAVKQTSAMVCRARLQETPGVRDRAPEDDSAGDSAAAGPLSAR